MEQRTSGHCSPSSLLCPSFPVPFLNPSPQGLPPGDSAPKLELLLGAQCSPLLQTQLSQWDVQGREGKAQGTGLSLQCGWQGLETRRCEACELCHKSQVSLCCAAHSSSLHLLTHTVAAGGLFPFFFGSWLQFLWAVPA